MGMTLDAMGWSSFFQTQVIDVDDGHLVGRVVEELRSIYKIWTPEGEVQGTLAGKFHHQVAERSQIPTIGDWVVVRAPGQPGGLCLVERLLVRKSKFARQAAGSIEEQVIAANIDTVFIVTSMNEELKPRRLERYLAAVWESGAVPVVVLSKADLCEDKEGVLQGLRETLRGVDALAMSAIHDESLDVLESYLVKGQTIAVVGSSGVGKSTLIQRITGVEIRIEDISGYQDRGRHTTTHKTLLTTPSGALIIDTPGMREFAPWETEDAISHTFEDVEGLSSQCKFSNCGHDTEPGCAVKVAIDEGRLEAGRLTSYRKLERERQRLERKLSSRSDNSKQKFREVTKAYRKSPTKRDPID